MVGRSLAKARLSPARHQRCRPRPEFKRLAHSDVQNASQLLLHVRKEPEESREDLMKMSVGALIGETTKVSRCGCDISVACRHQHHIIHVICSVSLSVCLVVYLSACVDACPCVHISI